MYSISLVMGGVNVNIQWREWMESKTVMVIVENTQFSGTETLCDPLDFFDMEQCMALCWLDVIDCFAPLLLL